MTTANKILIAGLVLPLLLSASGKLLRGSIIWSPPLKLDEVKGSVDLTPFRQKFAGDDKDIAAAFDEMTTRLVKITFTGAARR
jgi:hypothetical protein